LLHCGSAFLWRASDVEVLYFGSPLTTIMYDHWGSNDSLECTCTCLLQNRRAICSCTAPAILCRLWAVHICKALN